MKQVLKIGLTYTGSDEKHSNYVNWLTGDDRVEIIKMEAGHTDPLITASLDGVVLSGGIDMHPKYYAGVNGYPNAPDTFNEARDLFEMEVFKQAMQHQIPFLGICRGMQLANCVLGGTLHQDLGEAANKLHRFDQQDKLHTIEIVPGTLLRELTKQTSGKANSAHHQAINKTGEGLLVNALSPDGVIEGVEWKDKSDKAFFLCVQWHPERMYKHGLEDLPSSRVIRNAFIQSIKKQQVQHEDH